MLVSVSHVTHLTTTVGSYSLLTTIHLFLTHFIIHNVNFSLKCDKGQLKPTESGEELRQLNDNKLTLYIIHEIQLSTVSPVAGIGLTQN